MSDETSQIEGLQQELHALQQQIRDFIARRISLTADSVTWDGAYADGWNSCLDHLRVALLPNPAPQQET